MQYYQDYWQYKEKYYYKSSKFQIYSDLSFVHRDILALYVHHCIEALHFVLSENKICQKKVSFFGNKGMYTCSIVVLERQQHCIHNKQANKSLTHRLKWKFSYKVANSEIVMNFILGMVFLLKNIELVSRSSTAIN